MKKIIIYTPKSGTPDKNYYNIIKNGVDEYIEQSKKIKNGGYENINLSEYESRNSGCDLEASYLCHGIWDVIMKNQDKKWRNNSFNWKNGQKSMLFHFDIMNNPIRQNNKGCMLAQKDDSNVQEWKKLYHTVGNMTPTPWFNLYADNQKSLDAQILHKAFDERWDLFLRLLQNNWSWLNSKNDNNISFVEYIKLTCQQMYFKEIYQNIMNDFKIDLINEKVISGWDQTIGNNNEMEIIEFPEKDAAAIINNLIKIRCKVIEVKLIKNISEYYNTDTAYYE